MNAQVHSSDDTNNITRSPLTNHHNSFHTWHSDKNPKNKQQNNYYIKHHYHLHNPPSSSHSTSIIDDYYQIEMSSTYRIKPQLAFILALILLSFLESFLNIFHCICSYDSVFFTSYIK